MQNILLISPLAPKEHPYTGNVSHAEYKGDKLVFDAESFELVHILGHVKDASVYAEAFRVLKKDGTLRISRILNEYTQTVRCNIFCNKKRLR